jgi:tripartite-type tricarboxylate transporter receptor subunit TctC
MCLFRAAAHTLYAALLLLDIAGAAVAQTPAEFFKGRNVTLLIGFGVGGDDDLWGRVIAKHMGNHIPGRPIVVPQNVPGAAGLLVANRLYSVAPRDGTVIGMINRGIPFEPLLGAQGANFDVLKMNWIGSPNRDTTVCAARKDAAVQSMRDLFARELNIGATGSGADTATYPEFLSAVVGMKFKVVRGYQGSHEIQLAMERNEVQGICLAYDSLARGILFRANELNVLLQAALDPDPRLDNVPSGIDFAHSDEERQALELFFARAAIGAKCGRGFFRLMVSFGGFQASRCGNVVPDGLASHAQISTARGEEKGGTCCFLFCCSNIPQPEQRPLPGTHPPRTRRDCALVGRTESDPERPCNGPAHSITSSARPSSVSGKVRPSALGGLEG